MNDDCRHLQEFPGCCELGDSCVIKAAHGRLREAHRHWHSAIKNYSELDGLRTYFNGTVQALRNVTFMIQGAKSNIPDFDRWYANWQNALRADPLMKWSVEKRNRVAKSADFEAASFALVSLRGSLNAKPVIEIKASPAISNVALAAQLMRRINATESLIKHGVIRVERRWIDVELPSVEVLEALAYAFSRLAGLVSDCHRHLGNPENSRWQLHSSDSKGVLIGDYVRLVPSCMIDYQDALAAWIKTADGSEISIKGRPINLNFDMIPVAVERYGHRAIGALKSAFDASTLEERVRGFCNAAAFLLEKDGYHMPVAWLFRENNVVWSGFLHIPDNSAKHLIWDELKRQVLRTMADEVVVVSERWSGKLDPKEPDRRVEDMPEREECLGVDGINKRGEGFGLLAQITRVKGGTQVGEAVSITTGKSFYLDDIREVWGLPRQDYIEKATKSID